MATDFTIKKSISMPKSLVALAKARAKGQHRTFSNYLQTLIAKDAEQGRLKK